MKVLAPEGDAPFPTESLPHHLRGSCTRSITHAHAFIVLGSNVLRWSPEALAEHIGLLVRAGVFASAADARSACLQDRALLRSMTWSKTMQLRAAVEAAGLSAVELRSALMCSLSPQRTLEAALLHAASGCDCQPPTACYSA